MTMAAWELTHNGRAGVRKGIIFETDGQPNTGVAPGPNYCALANAAATAAKAQNIEVFTIGFGLDAASGGDPACPDTSGTWKGKTATALLDSMATQPNVGTTTCDATENNDDDHFYCIGKTGASTDLSKIFKAAASQLAKGKSHLVNLYPIPVVTGVSPSSGSHNGGTSVTISGSFFTGATSVTFNGWGGLVHRGQRHDHHRDGTGRRDRHDGRHLRDDTGRDDQPGQRGPLHLHLIGGAPARDASRRPGAADGVPILATMFSGSSAGGHGTRPHGSCSWTTTGVCSSRSPSSSGSTASTSRPRATARRRSGASTTAWPDLLIIDLLMPRMDGLTLAREIKARADLPIIVLSAIDAGDNKADLLDEFAEDYITKPYHYSELRARIQRVLRRVGERVPRKGLDLGPRPHPRAPPAPGDRPRRGRSS